MIRTLFILLLMGFLNSTKWPKHSIQQLYQLNYTNSFDFIDKFLKIKQPKFDIYVANPKPKPAMKNKPYPTPKTEPKPAENFIIPEPKVWRNYSLWLWEQIFNKNV